MKRIQIGRFDPARLLTYLLSRLVDAHSVGGATSKSDADQRRDEPTRLPRSPARAVGDILKGAE